MESSNVELIRSCFEKYQNRFGYITFGNHLKVYRDFLNQVKYIPSYEITEEQYIARRKVMISMLEILQGVVDLHKANGCPCKIDWGEL